LYSVLPSEFLISSYSAFRLCIADRVGAHMFGQVGADQHRLTGQFDLALNSAFLVQALLLGFLRQQFAAYEFFLDGVLQLGGFLGALSFLLGDEKRRKPTAKWLGR
jgi:hypothetical protein